MRLVCILIAAAGLMAVLDVAAAQEKVAIPNGGTRLRGVLYRPAGTGPFPAVVALHGCGGLASKSGAITERFEEWGERLKGLGFVVLFPDSFASRGLGSQCRVRARDARASAERVDDANAARAWLQRQSWVTRERVSLLGWSNGGTTALWTIRNKATPADGDFHSAVAFYPGCSRLQKAGWTPRLPVLILSGAADDWTPAAPCQHIVDAAQGDGARAVIIVYKDAYHDFDAAGLALKRRAGVAFSANGSGIVHIGTNDAARADAIKRVPEWLAR